MKKLLSLVLAIVLVAALAVPALAEAATYPLVEETANFTMMGYKHPIQGAWENLWFFKFMEEKTNVHFTFDTPASDAFEERKMLALNSGDYPDVFFGGNFSREQIIKYGSDEGILIPLEQLIEENCPNILAMFEAYPDVKKSITAPDGHIYALPNISMGVNWTDTFWYNYEWLKALNITEDQLPTTVDGLYELLKRFATEDPNGNGEADEIPLSLFDQAGTFGSLDQFNSLLLPAFGVLRNDIYVDKDGKVQYGLLQENFAHFIEFANKLWTEKLIDQDSFAQDYASTNAKCKANLVGLAGQAIPQNLYDCADSDVAVNYPVAPAMSSAYQETPVVASSFTGITQGTFAITTKCADPVLMMKWVDYLFSEEGSLMIHYGPEGTLWEYADDEKYLMKYIIPTDGRSTEELRGGDLTPDCGTALPKWVRDDTEYRWDDAFQQYRLNTCIAKKLAPYAQLIKPDMFTTVEEQSRLDVLLTDINKYAASMEAKLITGEATVDQIPEMQQQLKDMGVEEVISIYQTAYDRWANS